MEVKVYNTEGKESGKLSLPEAFFGAEWNGDLVSQVLYVQQMNRRAGTAHTKDRGEVRGSNKKPWAQKGSGRARHGSTRSPIWRHGGVTFGPNNEKSYKRDMPKAMRNRALYALLSAKLKDGKILFVEDVALNEGKTKVANTVMHNLSAITGFENLVYPKKNNVYLTTAKLGMNEKRAFRNLPFVEAHNMEDLNPLDVANARYLIIANPAKLVEYLNNKK